MHFTIFCLKTQKKLAQKEYYGIIESGVERTQSGFPTQDAIETAFFIYVFYTKTGKRRSNKNRIWKEQYENGKHE